MTLEADLEALVKAGAGWDGVAAEIAVAKSGAAQGEGQGSNFGWYADRAGIPQAHDTFIAAMVTALGQGNARAERIADLLRDTAALFGATDLKYRDIFHKADGTPA